MLARLSWSEHGSGSGSAHSGQWSGQTVLSLGNGGQSLFGLVNTYFYVWSVWSPTVGNPSRSAQYLSWFADFSWVTLTSDAVGEWWVQKFLVTEQRLQIKSYWGMKTLKTKNFWKTEKLKLKFYAEIENHPQARVFMPQ